MICDDEHEHTTTKTEIGMHNQKNESEERAVSLGVPCALPISSEMAKICVRKNVVVKQSTKQKYCMDLCLPTTKTALQRCKAKYTCCFNSSREKSVWSGVCGGAHCETLLLAIIILATLYAYFCIRLIVYCQRKVKVCFN